MAGYISDDTRKVTTHRLVEMKQRGEKISMLTAYDYTMAQIVDGAGMDVILVGDSASNVMAGNVTTLPITLDQMIYHAKSVVRGVKRAMVVVDMPFGSYQGNEMEGLASAIRIMKESHADALKLEGGEEIIDTVKRIVCAGIPVMGHLGLMPQSINKYGTYTVRAKDEAEADKLIRDAHLLEEAGCFAIVLEKIPATLAERVASELTIPIIGIGAGGHVDGQVLVIQDMLGMNNGFRPRVPNSPKRYYPHLITLGQSVNLKYIAQKMQDRSSLSVGDIKSVIQNFVEKMKEQLLEGKSVNIEGLGVFMLTARSKGAELAKDINAKSVESVRIFFQANKELRVTKTATRADEKLDLISLDEYLKKLNMTISPNDPEKPDDGGEEGGGNESGGSGEAPDPAA